MQNKKTLAGICGTGAAAMLLACVPMFEGVILRGYKDPIGIVTACAGHTLTAVLGKPYTKEECAVLLEQDLVEHAEGAMSCVHVETTEGQRAAFISFAFNVGTTAWCNSTANRLLNQGDYAGACAQLSRWTLAGGRELPGLVKRRSIEKAMCLGDAGNGNK